MSTELHYDDFSLPRWPVFLRYLLCCELRLLSLSLAVLNQIEQLWTLRISAYAKPLCQAASPLAPNRVINFRKR